MTRFVGRSRGCPSRPCKQHLQKTCTGPRKIQAVKVLLLQFSGGNIVASGTNRKSAKPQTPPGGTCHSGVRFRHRQLAREKKLPLLLLSTRDTNPCGFSAGVTPQILVRPRELTHVTSGVTFVLSCVAMGDPTPTVQWFKKGLPIAKNVSRISVFENGVSQFCTFIWWRVPCKLSFPSKSLKKPVGHEICQSTGCVSVRTFWTRSMSRRVPVDLGRAHVGQRALYVRRLQPCRPRHGRRQRSSHRCVHTLLLPALEQTQNWSWFGRDGRRNIELLSGLKLQTSDLLHCKFCFCETFFGPQHTFQ